MELVTTRAHREREAADSSIPETQCHVSRSARRFFGDKSADMLYTGKGGGGS